MNSDKQYQQGHFIGIGIAIGLPLGIPIGLALGNIALGIPLGLPIGLAIGIAMEKTLNKNLIPISPDQRAQQRKWAWVSVVIGLVVLGVLLSLYLWMR